MTQERNPAATLTPYAKLVRRAGLTSSMASRIAGVDTRTGRRWASGTGTGSSPPDATLFLLTSLAEENERAKLIEARGEAAKRPIRDRAIQMAIERELAYRARREAKGNPVSPVPTRDLQRAIKAADRALRQTWAGGPIPRID